MNPEQPPVQLIYFPLIVAKAIPMLVSSAAIYFVNPSTEDVSQGVPAAIIPPTVQLYAETVPAIMSADIRNIEFFILLII